MAHHQYEYELNADEEQLPAEQIEVPHKKVPHGDVFEAARAGDLDRLRALLDSGINVNARDAWDSVALYYACLAGHSDAARLLLDSGAICSEHTFDGDRCHYAALNLRVRNLLKAYEARPPPLPPLPDALRSAFFRSGENSSHLDPTLQVGGVSGDSSAEVCEPDIVFLIDGRTISAHRAILAARSPFLRKKFETEWRGRREVRLFRERLCFTAFFSLVTFFYCDRLDVLVEDMAELVRICKVCGCWGLQVILEREMLHQRYAEFKSYKLSKADESVRRFMLQGSSLAEEERLSAAMERLWRASLGKSLVPSLEEEEDFADVCFVVAGRRFRCHRVVLSARSDYIRALIGFRSGGGDSADDLLLLEENGLNSDTFEKLLHYIYTDQLDDVDLDQAEELLDAASRYLLFPLKRVLADSVLPLLENASLAFLCHWLIISDMYGAIKIKEYCLNLIAENFESFASTSEFKSMLQRLPPPSGDSSIRTTAPGTHGETVKDQGNLLDDLRETWLNIEGEELDKRDQSAKEFDKVLELLRASAAEDEDDL